MILSLMAMVCVLTLSAQSLYDFKVKNDADKEVSLAEYKGKVLLIVNTATRCTRSTAVRGWRFWTSPVTNSDSRPLARFRRFTSSARSTSISSSHNSTRLR